MANDTITVETSLDWKYSEVHSQAVYSAEKDDTKYFLIKPLEGSLWTAIAVKDGVPLVTPLKGEKIVNLLVLDFEDYLGLL